MEDTRNDSTFTGTPETIIVPSNQKARLNLPMQSASLFSKNGFLRRRDIGGGNNDSNRGTELEGNYTFQKQSTNEMQSVKRKNTTVFKDSADLRLQFKSGLKRIQKSQITFYLSFLALLVSFPF